MIASSTTVRSRRLRPALALIALLSSASPASGEPATRQGSAPRAFELIRMLWGELGASVSDGEIASSLVNDQCDAKCVQNLELVHRELVASRGRPSELIIRHQILTSAHFYDNPQPIYAALLRTDPPSVIDVANKAVMTRSDLIGMINLWRFGNGDGEPEHIQPSERELRELASELDGVLKKRGRFPVYGLFAAELWLGVQQAWPSLTAAQRRAVRGYAGRGVEQPLSGALYARLLGLKRADGDALHKHEVAMLSPPASVNSSERRKRFEEAYFKLGLQPLPWRMAR